MARHIYIHSFLWHAVLRNLFDSSLSYTRSFHPFPPISFLSSLTSSCHLFLGLPLSLIVSKFIYNTFLGILFSSILPTYPNQRNLFYLNASVIVGVLTLHKLLYWLISSNFLFHCHILGLKFFYTLSSQKNVCFLSLFVSIQVSDAYVKVVSIIVFFSLNFSFLDIFLFLKYFCSIKYFALHSDVETWSCTLFS